MLMNARIKDTDNNDVEEVVAVHYINGKLHLSVDMDFEDEDDGGDGAKDDIPEADASKPKFPKIVAVGKGRKKDGTDG